MVAIVSFIDIEIVTACLQGIIWISRVSSWESISEKRNDFAPHLTLAWEMITQQQHYSLCNKHQTIRLQSFQHVLRDSLFLQEYPANCYTNSATAKPIQSNLQKTTHRFQDVPNISNLKRSSIQRQNEVNNPQRRFLEIDIVTDQIVLSQQSDQLLRQKLSLQWAKK